MCVLNFLSIYFTISIASFFLSTFYFNKLVIIENKFLNIEHSLAITKTSIMVECECGTIPNIL